MHVIVIGAGVVGAATTLALVERGVRVTLIERSPEAAAETSHANGGGITPLHSEPWNAPGLLGKLVRNIGRPDSPYKLYPLAVPGMGLWGLKFLAHMRKSRFEANARRNFRLGLYSLDCLRRWGQTYDIDFHRRGKGSLQVYFDPELLDQAMRLRVELLDGLAPVERIGADQAIEREPALAPVGERLAGAILFPDHECGDACLFSQGVVRIAERLGAELHFATRVTGIVRDRDGFRAVDTDHGRFQADACVLAAGPDAAKLARSAGERLPIYPVRGYSATFELDDPGPAPHMPMLDMASRFVTLRLGERHLRVAGLADFAGHRKEIPVHRVESLLAGARKLLPALADELASERAGLWAGLRPVTPDGLPLLGPSRLRGLYVNAGHGPMGWTTACGSARALADLVIGKSPEIDLRDYAVHR